MFSLSSYDFVHLFCFGIGSGHQRAYGYKVRWWTRMCLGGPMSSCCLFVCLYLFVCLFYQSMRGRIRLFACFWNKK